MKKTIAVAVAAFAIGYAPSACAADAAANYKTMCVKCHGADGKGQTAMGKKVGIKDYTDPKVQEKFTDAEAFKSLKEGMKEKGTDKVLMKPVENVSDQDIKDLVAYVRKFKK
jgi:cytochrome c553